MTIYYLLFERISMKGEQVGWIWIFTDCVIEHRHNAWRAAKPIERIAIDRLCRVPMSMALVNRHEYFELEPFRTTCMPPSIPVKSVNKENALVIGRYDCEFLIFISTYMMAGRMLTKLEKIKIRKSLEKMDDFAKLISDECSYLTRGFM